MKWYGLFVGIVVVAAVGMTFAVIGYMREDTSACHTWTVWLDRPWGSGNGRPSQADLNWYKTAFEVRNLACR